MLDVADLENAKRRLSLAMEGHLEPVDANGHPDVQWLPHMGPRYKHVGRAAPLSVFMGEGMALYVAAQALRPTCVADCFTGTGLAAACLALGAPEASVFTADTYTEGGAGDAGEAAVRAWTARLGLPNLHVLRGSVQEIAAAVRDRKVDLAVFDPEGGHDLPWAEEAVVVNHDNRNIINDRPCSFMVRGGSWLTFSFRDAGQRDFVRAEIERLVGPTDAR